MQKPLGVLGGTFDPIHNGHLSMAKQVLKQLDLASVHFIPCYQPVHRRTPIANPEQRLTMVQLAIGENPMFIADETEIKRHKPSYMIDTLQELRRQYAQQPLVLMLSSDAFLHIFSWKNWQDILTFCHIAITNRRGYEITHDKKLLNYIKAHETSDRNALHCDPAGAIMQVLIDPLPISGTEIRESLAKVNNPEQYVSPKVWQYIQQQHLYGV